MVIWVLKVHKSLASAFDEDSGERVVNAFGFIKLMQVCIHDIIS